MPKKILIIDDDPVVVKYLQAVFSDNGYETCSASSSALSEISTTRAMWAASWDDTGSV